MDKNYFGSNLKYLRKKHGKSQSDVAIQLKKNYTSVGNWENDFNQPVVSDIVIIANIFGVTLDDLLNNDLSKGGDSLKSTYTEIENKDGDSGGDYGGYQHKNILVSEPETFYFSKCEECNNKAKSLDAKSATIEALSEKLVAMKIQNSKLLKELEKLQNPISDINDTSP